MSYFGLAMTPRCIIVADERGLLLAEAALDSIVAMNALIRRVGAQPDVQLVVTEDHLRECPPLGMASACRITLCIVPTELAEGARVLARISTRSTRRRAALMAQLPSVPGIARFLRRAAPLSEHQLTLL